MLTKETFYSRMTSINYGVVRRRQDASFVSMIGNLLLLHKQIRVLLDEFIDPDF